MTEHDANEDAVIYTTVVHKARQELGVSLNEYILLDMVTKLQVNTKHPGWCYSGRTHLANQLGIERTSLSRLIKRLSQTELLTVDSKTRFLKASIKFHRIVNFYREKINNPQRGVLEGDTVCNNDTVRVPQGQSKSNRKTHQVLPKDTSDVTEGNTYNNTNNNNYKDSDNKKEGASKDAPREEPSKNPSIVENEVQDLSGSENSSPSRESEKGPRFDPSQWMYDVYVPMYQDCSGRPAEIEGRERGQAKIFFDKMRKFYPDATDEELYEICSGACELVFRTYLTGGAFDWLKSEPDIGFLAANVSRIEREYYKTVNKTEADIEQDRKVREGLKGLKQIEQEYMASQGAGEEQPELPPGNELPSGRSGNGQPGKPVRKSVSGLFSD